MFKRYIQISNLQLSSEILMKKILEKIGENFLLINS